MSLALFVFTCAYGLWVMFIAVMALRWAWYRLSVPVRVLAAPLLSACATYGTRTRRGLIKGMDMRRAIVVRRA